MRRTRIAALTAVAMLAAVGTGVAVATTPLRRRQAARERRPLRRRQAAGRVPVRAAGRARRGRGRPARRRRQGGPAHPGVADEIKRHRDEAAPCSAAPAVLRATTAGPAGQDSTAVRGTAPRTSSTRPPERSASRQAKLIEQLRDGKSLADDREGERQVDGRRQGSGAGRPKTELDEAVKNGRCTRRRPTRCSTTWSTAWTTSAASRPRGFHHGPDGPGAPPPPRAGQPVTARPRAARRAARLRCGDAARGRRRRVLPPPDAARVALRGELGRRRRAGARGASARCRRASSTSRSRCTPPGAGAGGSSRTASSGRTRGCRRPTCARSCASASCARGGGSSGRTRSPRRAPGRAPRADPRRAAARGVGARRRRLRRLRRALRPPVRPRDPRRARRRDHASRTSRSSARRATGARAPRSARIARRGRRGAAHGGGRAAARADPRRHLEPARQRDGGGRAAARLPRPPRDRVRARRAQAGPREPRRADPRRGGGPSLALTGHTDVVPADARDWQRPPFSGDLDDDGYIWGRGAVDMKSHTATNAVALATLAREGFRPRGDLLLIAQADEEDGSEAVGMQWLVEERPDLRAGHGDRRGRRRAAPAPRRRRGGHRRRRREGLPAGAA